MRVFYLLAGALLRIRHRTIERAGVAASTQPNPSNRAKDPQKLNSTIKIYLNRLGLVQKITKITLHKTHSRASSPRSFSHMPAETQSLSEQKRKVREGFRGSHQSSQSASTLQVVPSGQTVPGRQTCDAHHVGFHDVHTAAC